MWLVTTWLQRLKVLGDVETEAIWPAADLARVARAGHGALGRVHLRRVVAQYDAAVALPAVLGAGKGEAALETGAEAGLGGDVGRAGHVLLVKEGLAQAGAVRVAAEGDVLVDRGLLDGQKGRVLVHVDLGVAAARLGLVAVAR